MYWVRYFALQSRIIRLIYEKTLFSYLGWLADPGKRAEMKNRTFPPFNIGIIGVGKHAKEVILPSLTYIQNIKIKKMCTRTEQNAKKIEREFNIETVTNFRKIINDPEIDGVIISAKSSLHTPFTLSALLAGKYVLCEAPGVTLPADIYLLKKYEDKILQCAMYGFHFFYCPIYVKLKEILQNIHHKKEIYIKFPAKYHLYSLALFLNGRIKKIRILNKGGEYERVFEGCFDNGDRVIF
ncbi:MAG: Gfo/Idh/MocA family oxidoreductase, partial [Candidatus Hydrogenedentota bacterium]